MGTRRTGSYVLAIFALLWLGMIYASEFGWAYTIDAVLQPHGRDAVVVSASPALVRLGLRPGSVVLLSRMNYADKVRLLVTGQRGMPITLIVRQGAGTRTIVAPATKMLSPPSFLRSFISSFDVPCITFSLLLAGYLGFRRPGLMIAALILFLGGGDISWERFAVFFSALPNAVYAPLNVVLSDLAGWFPILALASFAVRLPGGEPVPAKRVAIGIVDAIVLAGFVAGLLPGGLPDALYDACIGFCALVVIAACMISLHYAKPSDRGRVAIVFAGIMVGGIGYAGNSIGIHHGEPLLWFDLYTTLSILIVPLSLAYAILRHRVFDVAFVLNRTIVYTITSSVVLLLFAALEFTTERLLSSLTQIEGIAVQFGIAMLVIVSVRLVHRRVDTLVDGVLFRSRHEQETALRRFSTTAQFYTQETALLRDTVDALGRYGRVQGAAVYVAGRGAGLQLAQSSFSVAVPNVDENDTAYVELRAHHEVLSAHAVSTALPGDRLYPMVLAGRIVGIVATGQRESGEQVPPDVDGAIRSIVGAVAIALAAIESDRIRQENAMLQARLATT
jgi:hypothetical protein